MEPTFGCNLRDFLFEKLEDPGIHAMIKYVVEKALKTWEPRIIVKDIVISNIDQNGEVKLFLDIYINIIKYEIDTNVTYILP